MELERAGFPASPTMSGCREKLMGVVANRLPRIVFIPNLMHDNPAGPRPALAA
jgi:hypothetical protein